MARRVNAQSTVKNKAIETAEPCGFVGRRDKITRMGQHRCVDCSKVSPSTETAYTLIGSKFRWRIEKRSTEDGTFVHEWRCPDCWKKHKDTAKGPSIKSPAPDSGSFEADARRSR